MAIKKVIEIKAETKQAQRSLEQLGDIIEEQKEITIEFEKELADLERQLKDTAKNNLPAQKALKKRIEGQKDAIKDNRLALKELNFERSKVKAVKTQEKASKKLNKTYFESNEAMTDVNRLTREYALKLKGLKNLMVASAQSAWAFVKGLSGIKKALLATGVGAIVVALGVIVAYWEEITDYINGTNKALERQIRLNEESIKVLDNKIDILEAEEKLLEAQGLSTAQNKKLQEEVLNIKKSELEVLITNLELRAKEKELDVVKLSFLEKVEAFARASAGLPLLVTPKITEEESKAVQDINDALTKARIELINVKTGIVELNAPDKDEGKKGKDRKRVKPLKVSLDEDQELRDDAALKQRLAQQQADRLLNTAKQEAREEDLANEKILHEQKIQMAGRTAGMLANILGEQTAAGKAAAIAQATINTYQGITNVWAEKAESGLVGVGLAQRLATTAIVAAQGFAAVKSIVGTPNPFGGSSSGDSGGGGAGQPLAPEFNVVGSSSTNQLAESISQQQNVPIKAFVVGKDVTTQQEMDRAIVNTATFG